MKRILSSILLLLVFCLTSCSESVNMFVLTDYQNKDFTASLKLSVSGTEYLADMEKQGGCISIVFRDTADFSFISEKGTVFIETDGLSIPLESAEALKISRIFGLFSVTVSDTWKIEKVRTGSVCAYVCDNGECTLYIGAETRLPLRIVSGDISADIISFTLNSD